MDIEIVDPDPEPELRYSDLRTGQTFCWWQPEGITSHEQIYLKGEQGYTRLCNGDIFENVVRGWNPRVIPLRVVLTVERP